MPVHRPPDKPPLEALETEIVDIKPHRTSKKRTPYCALVLPSGDWVFVWEGHWKDEIETMYVYECPLEHHRYWYPEEMDKYESLPCETCGASCEPVDQFTFNPFSFEPPERLPV